MDLLDKESIILQIGDLKLSDTYDTFGEKKYVNGILYLPLINPHGKWCYPVGLHLASGDSREGVAISKNDNTDEIFFTYGANRPSSNAQSMAIGYQDENGFFFVMENFRDIYDKAPSVSSREIVRCKFIFEPCGTRKTVYLNFDSAYKAKLTKPDKVSFQKLLSKVQTLKDAFSEENLSKLRRTRK